ncbi:MAG: hypothetical protein RL380_1628, partial [Verrucomicrobiota bacterium]
NSSAGSNSVTATSETLFAFDANPTAITGTNYAATLRTANDFQLSDAVDGTNYGLVLSASFYVGTNVTGTNATLAAPSYASGQFSFTVTGTTGASYVVQATTNLTTWFNVATNLAPFTYTETNAANFLQRFYRAVTP